MFSRRIFLKYGLVGGSLISVITLGIGLQSSKMRSRRNESPLQVFSEVEFSILSAIADTISPKNPPFPSASDLLVPFQIDALLSQAHPDVQMEIKALLHLFENGLTNLFVQGYPTPFSQLDPQTQQKILANWRTSTIFLRRKVYKALNGLCQSTYYANPQVHSNLGYEGPPAYLLELVKSAGEY